MTARPGRATAAALTAAVTGVAGSRLLRRGPTPQSPWTRRNYRDHDVTLLLGPVTAGAVLAGTAWLPARQRWPAAAALCAAATVGAYDDLAGDTHARGLAGHGQALRAGRLTTGQVKLVVLVTTGALTGRSTGGGWPDRALATVLVAGGANLANLFDLRPGRACKVALLAAAGLAAGGRGTSRTAAAAAVGGTLAGLPADLAERGMLGDCGAGAIGALLGWGAAQLPGRGGRLLAAALVVGLTLASERVSFSAVIDGSPTLRALDRLGRAES